jgi:hypothetical protein
MELLLELHQGGELQQGASLQTPILLFGTTDTHLWKPSDATGPNCTGLSPGPFFYRP